VKYLLKRK